MSKKKYPPLKPIAGFGDKGMVYDALLQFWIEYWKSQGVPFPKDLDPLLIKALIAFESGFNEKARNKTSTAEGLMQITDQSMRVLGGYPNKKKWIESREHLIHVEKTDKIDPVVNIALGVRLLGHKFSQIKNNREKTARRMIECFHSKERAGKDYGDRIYSLYENSLKPK